LTAHVDAEGVVTAIRRRDGLESSNE